MDSGQAEKRVVEIRIHGVGGEPAGQLLDDPHPRLTAGDEISGFHLPAETGEYDIPERQRQALCWGGNTSGSWKNALWILLLPFALVNVAGYMHKPRKPRDPAGAPYEQPAKRMRWLGLSVTLSAVALAAATAYDLLAIQCGGAPDCAGRVRFLAPYLWQLNGHIPIGDSPARRLGLATVVPLGFLSMLWFAGKYAYEDLEHYLNDRLPPASDPPAPLADRSFWNGYESSFRARMIHLIAGRAFVAAMLTWCILKIDESAGQGWGTVLLLTVSGLVLFLSFVVIASERVHRSEKDDSVYAALACLQILSWAVLGAALGRSAGWEMGDGRPYLFAAPALLAISLCFARAFKHNLPRLLLHAVPFAAGFLAALAAIPGKQTAEPHLGFQGSPFAGFFGAPYQFAWGLAFVQATLITLLACTPVPPKFRSGRGTPLGPPWAAEDLKRHAFNGRGSAVFAIFGTFLMIAVAAGVHRGVANLIADPVNEKQSPVRLSSEPGVGPAPGEDPERQNLLRAVIPWWYETTAHSLVFLLGALVVCALLFVRGLKKGEKADRAEALEHLRSDAEFANEIDESKKEDRERLKRVLRRWAFSRELAAADRKFTMAVWISTLAGIVLLALQVPASTPGLKFWAEIRPAGLGRPFGALATFSLWFVGLLPLATVLLLRLAAQKESWRRQIGRLWDVLMFWPRSIQPFAPPCYSERVVPQLRLHIDRLHEQGRQVVVGGHSQGSVIAAAAVAIGRLPEPGSASPGLDHSDSRKLDLVVYGSPLSILYERSFPAYFGQGFFEAVEKGSVRWHHFFARTDVFALPLWDGAPVEVISPCPVCGFYVQATSPITPDAKRADYILVDPVFWDWPTEEPPRPPIMGHSTYATGTHPRFEQHMQTIATHAFFDTATPEEAT